jgi:hypothetical protein
VWVDGHSYLNFLHTLLSALLKHVSLNTHLCICFQHEDAPPHYSYYVCQRLSKNYPRRWIGCGSEVPLTWPACSPDLNPVGIFEDRSLYHCSHSREELWHWIQQF